MSLPPLLTRWLAWFEASPLPAGLVALAVVLVALILLRVALKAFLIFVLLLILAGLGSYFFLGEAETEAVIRRGVQEALPAAPPSTDGAAPADGASAPRKSR